MIVKKHVNEGRLVLAICDSDIIGKKFSEDNKQLDLTSSFYKGEEMEKEELKKLIKKAHIINAVGKESVSFLIKEKLVDKKNIIEIENVPHAQYALF